MKGAPAPKRGPYQTPRPSDDAGGGSHGSIRPLHDQRIGNARLCSGNVRPWPEISGPDLESRRIGSESLGLGLETYGPGLKSSGLDLRSCRIDLESRDIGSGSVAGVEI